MDVANKIFQSARAYSAAAYLINAKASEQPPLNLHLALPSAVIAGFALELHFKTLYYLERGSEFKIRGKYSHDFSNLFDELSDQTKQEITSHYNNLLKNVDMSQVKEMENVSSVFIPLDLKSQLNEWKGVFTEKRYIYNSKGKGTSMWFFGEIEEAILLSIYRLKPEWKRQPVAQADRRFAAPA